VPGGDIFGDLEDYLGTSTFPRWDKPVSEGRLYFMGINNGTPTAVNNLLKGMMNGDFFSAATITSALAKMRQWSPLVTSIPGNIGVVGKGGSNNIFFAKPVNDTAIFQLGPDTLVIGVYTRDATWTRADLKRWFRRRFDSRVELTRSFSPMNRFGLVRPPKKHPLPPDRPG